MRMVRAPRASVRHPVQWAPIFVEFAMHLPDEVAIVIPCNDFELARKYIRNMKKALNNFLKKKPEDHLCQNLQKLRVQQVGANIEVSLPAECWRARK